MDPKWLTQAWSEDLAHEIEAVLIDLVKQVPTVGDPRGYSYDKVRDYKIHFRSSGARNPELNGFFLKFNPVKSSLEAWAGGLGYYFPEDVKDFIAEKFPWASYHLGAAPGVDGFHYWFNISEEDLRMASKS